MSARLLPYYALVALVMMSLGGIFTLLGELRDELGFEEWQLGVMVGAGFFTAFLSQVGLARFSDRGHSATMIRVGLIGLGVGTGTMAIADGYLWFLGARMLLGVGAGTLLPAVRRVVVVSDPDEVGRNLGLMGSFDVGGFLLGPIIAGVLAHFFDFRAPFIVFAAVTIIFIPAVARLPKDEGHTSEERRVLSTLIANPGIRAMLVVAVGWYAMIGLFETVWAVMLTDRGAETWFIALSLSVILVPMLFLAPIGGRVAQERGPLRVATVGVLAVIPLVAMYGNVEHLGILTAMAVVQGAIDSLIFPATQVGAAMAADEEMAASAQGLQGATLEVTAGFVAVIAGFLYDPIGPGAIFVGAAALMAIGATLAHFLSRELRREGHPVVIGRPLRAKVTV